MTRGDPGQGEAGPPHTIICVLLMFKLRNTGLANSLSLVPRTGRLEKRRCWKEPRFTAVIGRARPLPAATANAAERLVDYRPEQQNDCERRDRSNQAVRPEHLHVAAGADHRQAERILGAVAEHKRQRERRHGNADFLEDVTDDAEALSNIAFWMA